jgi:formylglycine-generating enzyme required for sulfatase activity
VVTDVTSAALLDMHQTVSRTCGPNAVIVGTVCLDRYEASVWRVPNPTTANANLVRRIRLGSATRAELTAGGATPLGTVRDDYAPCANDGENCTDDIYAVSLPSEIPAAHITWFQAQEACANADKRLPTSAEWQVGANGTPDPGPDNGATDCNTAAVSATLTGARSGCVSARGAFDMVGNLYEWVADWVPLSATCVTWGGFSNDDMCLAGANETALGPGALLRGGNFNSGTDAGPLAVDGGAEPSFTAPSFGFRCVRDLPRVPTRVHFVVDRPLERGRR